MQFGDKAKTLNNRITQTFATTCERQEIAIDFAPNLCSLLESNMLRSSDRFQASATSPNRWFRDGNLPHLMYIGISPWGYQQSSTRSSISR